MTLRELKKLLGKGRIEEWPFWRRFDDGIEHVCIPIIVPARGAKKVREALRAALIFGTAEKGGG